LLDVEHAVDVLIKLINREVYEDIRFIEHIETILENLQKNDQEETEGKSETYRQIQDFHMFYTPHEKNKVIRMGDIVNIKIEDKEFRGIIITPACDLANPKKTNYLRVALIRRAANKNEKTKDSVDKKRLMENGEINIVYLHELIVLKDETLIQNSTAASIMLYDHDFKTITEQEVQITREKRLDDPYRADLLHHFISHAGRIGVPDFK
jgi:hypothetical protein